MRVQSRIERRLLVNYRADPEVVAPLLPDGLRPLLVGGWAVVGICLIRLGEVRPYGLPGSVGVSSENAAHRIAVEWDTPDGPQPGVYIPRRHSGSTLTLLAGGRVFPGVHQRASFTVRESDSRVAVRVVGGGVTVDAEVVATEKLNDSRLFADLDAASAFFRAAPVGLSPGRDGRLEAVSLRADRWQMEAASPVRVASSFWDDATRFPRGSVMLDSALLMRGLRATWTPTAASAARTA
ncbi:DUF2071 domain-containing protein [Acidothermaceae bacterium B102]|nr:DUF2071 domain-containing protein [Acidothermaceae bacterium B102]